VRVKYISILIPEIGFSPCEDGFYGLMIYRCKLTACPFRVQVAILAMIKTTSDDDDDEYKEMGRCVIHLAIRNTHLKYAMAGLLKHPFAKYFKNPSFDHMM
jgi:hypothetical protein